MMTLKRTQFWRTWAGRTGAVLCLLLFLVIIEALVARFREPVNRFAGWPGIGLAVNGLLAEKIDRVQDLSYQTPSPDLRLDFENLNTGFWLGGNMWNGRLYIGPGIQPGRYPLAVLSGKGPEGGKVFLFQVEVFPDQFSLRKSSKSLLISRLGIYPWPAAGVLVPLIIMLFGAVFFLSHRTESLLTQQGKAEIYRIRKDDKGLEIFFGLGKNQGIKPGTLLTLINEQGKRLGSVTAEEVFEGHSTAWVDPGRDIRPGFFVSR
jgi:hypothetical protein